MNFHHSLQQRSAVPLSFQFIAGVTPLASWVLPPAASHFKLTLKIKYLSFLLGYL